MNLLFNIKGIADERLLDFDIWHVDGNKVPEKYLDRDPLDWYREDGSWKGPDIFGVCMAFVDDRFGRLEDEITFALDAIEGLYFGTRHAETSRQWLAAEIENAKDESNFGQKSIEDCYNKVCSELDDRL